MKINAWQLAASVLAEVAAIQSIAPGTSTELPPVHIKSGTTSVDIKITATEDAPKH